MPTRTKKRASGRMRYRMRPHVDLHSGAANPHAGYAVTGGSACGVCSACVECGDRRVKETACGYKWSRLEPHKAKKNFSMIFSAYSLGFQSLDR